METVCAKCNSLFTCKNEEANCWCNSIKLGVYTRQYLKENFTGCLCPACLQPFAEIDMNTVVDEDADDFWNNA